MRIHRTPDANPPAPRWCTARNPTLWVIPTLSFILPSHNIDTIDFIREMRN